MLPMVAEAWFLDSQTAMAAPKYFHFAFFQSFVGLFFSTQFLQQVHVAGLSWKVWMVTTSPAGTSAPSPLGSGETLKAVKLRGYPKWVKRQASKLIGSRLVN